MQDRSLLKIEKPNKLYAITMAIRRPTIGIGTTLLARVHKDLHVEIGTLLGLRPRNNLCVGPLNIFRAKVTHEFYTSINVSSFPLSIWCLMWPTLSS